MSKYEHFVEEIKAAKPDISNAELCAEVKARIAKEDPAPSRYDTHGLPDPMNTSGDVTDDVRNKSALITTGNKRNLMIQYVRKAKPRVGKVIVNVMTGSTSSKLVRGEPIGALVAFKDDNNLLVGWSKYNLKKDEEDNQIEGLVFTKKDAISTAVLRALTDNINEAAIPFKIANDLPAFLMRVEKYFGAKPNNMATAFGYA